jgi:hypothetical protein
VTRDTTGHPSGGGAPGPQGPSGRRRPYDPGEPLPGEPPWGETAWDESAWNEPGWDEAPRATGLTGPQHALPAWDGEPGFEFDARARAFGRDPFSPGLFDADEFNAGNSAPRGARAEWIRLHGSLRPAPAKRSWFADFRAALRFRGAGLRVIVPIVAMIVVGVTVTVIAGANKSLPGPAPPPAALGFPPATLAGAFFAAPGTGRGISQTLGAVASDGAEIVAVGSQQGARIARAQFFVSADGGRSWAIGAVRARGGGPPPPGYPARFVAGGPGDWVAIGPGSIWTSPDARTWTLASTAGLPLRPGDQVSVLKRTAAGFIAAGSNAPDGNQAEATPVVFLSADGTSWQRLGAGQLNLPAGARRVLGLRYAAAYGSQILIAGDVTLPPPSGTAQPAVTSAAWLSRDGGSTWTLAVPPGDGARARISGLAVTAAGFILTRPATAARRPAVGVYRSADGTRWMFEATLSTPAGFTAGPVSGGADGAVVSGQAGPALIAFASADGAAWRQTPAFGAAAAQDTSGVAVARGGTVVTAGTTTSDPDRRQPLLTVLGPPGTPAGHVDIANIPGAGDPQLTVDDVAAANSAQAPNGAQAANGASGLLVAVGSADGYPAAWVSSAGGSAWTRAAGQTPAVLDRPGIQQLSSVTYGAVGWLAVGGVAANAPQHPVVLASGNGRVWTAADGEPAFSQPGLVTEQAAAAEGTGYVIVGYQVIAGRTIAAAWWSAGLAGWQRAGDAAPGALDGSGGSRQMRAVTAAQHGFVAVGADGAAPAAWTSANGSAWTRQNVPLPVGAAGAVLTRVASNGRTLAAVGTALTTDGQQLPFAASSSDGGVTWAEAVLPVPAGRASVTALAAAGGGFLATGTFGAAPGHQDVVVWTSPAGAAGAAGSAWTAATPTGQGLTGPGIQAITGLTASGRTLTGVGYTATPSGEQPIFWQSPIR